MLLTEDELKTAARRLACMCDCQPGIQKVALAPGSELETALAVPVLLACEPNRSRYCGLVMVCCTGHISHMAAWWVFSLIQYWLDTTVVIYIYYHSGMSRLPHIYRRGESCFFTAFTIRVTYTIPCLGKL